MNVELSKIICIDHWTTKGDVITVYLFVFHKVGSHKVKLSRGFEASSPAFDRLDKNAPKKCYISSIKRDCDLVGHKHGTKKKYEFPQRNTTLDLS